ncbi:MAG: Rieske 2Fe-2S domain-containing protein [Acidobacteriota bacterium]|nr:Rieske 2Fe-2S domain-containing protein [Acidobacteriota bacterium]
MRLTEHVRKTNAWFFRYLRFRFQGHNHKQTEPSSNSLVRDQWYAILESRRVRQKPIALRRVGSDLVLWRDSSGQVVCFPDRCPHRGAKLSLGVVRDGCIECPYHGFIFDETGQCTFIPANGDDRPVPRGFDIRGWPVQEKHGLIWVWWGNPRAVYPEIPWFEQSAEDERHSAEKSGVWNFHYARIIENSLDAHHFPFIHGSINPNIGAVVDPYNAEESGDIIRVVAGLKRHRDEPDEKAVIFRMAFAPPNVMHVDLNRNIHLMQVATPIDDESTWMWVRYYQRFLQVPVIGRMVTRALLIGDWKIAQDMQDIPIFVTQRPAIPGLELGYKFIHADRGIAMFFNQRKRQMTSAERPTPHLVKTEEVREGTA